MLYNLESQPAAPLGLFKAGFIYIIKISAKFEFRYEVLKINFSFLILSVYNLMIVPSKTSENYPRKCF